MTAPSFVGDRGSVAVVVALMMVVLIGFAAVSIDVGANFALQRQLQNGADAAALAVAQESGCEALTNPFSGGVAVAQKNVSSSQVRTEGPNFEDAENEVSVDVIATDDSGTVDGRANLFASILAGDGSLDRTDVSATATAGCGYPLTGTATLPLTFHECHFTDPGSATAELIRYDNNAPDCSGEKSNDRPNGGFGFLAQDDGGCSAEVASADGNVDGVPGNSFPNSCNQMAQELRGEEVLIPIYDSFAKNGKKATYHIVGFATFRITGYRFSGSPSLSWNNAPSCTADCRGIIGTFVERVMLAEGYEGGGEDFGVTVVRLVA